MSGLLKLRLFGAAWAILVAALIALVEPAFLNGVFAVGMLVLTFGWTVLAGLLVKPPSGDEGRLLSETGATLVRCSREFGGQFDAMRAELLRAQQLISEAIAKLIESFHDMTDQSRRQQALGLRAISQGEGAGEDIDFAAVAGQSSESLCAFVDSVVANPTSAMNPVKMSAQQATLTLDARREVDKAMNRIAQMNANVSQTVADMQHIAEQMEQSVGQAVTSLQFQDMVTQLIDHVSKRLDQLHELAQDIEAASSLVESGAASGAEPQQVDRLRAHLRAVCAALDALAEQTGNNPVQQGSFGSGEVVLF